MIKQIKKLLTPADIILIAVLLFLSLLSLYAISAQSSEKQVRIKHHNEIIYSGNIKIDKIIEIEKDIVVEIRDGKVRMQKSNCPKQYCVKQGWSDNLPIICVPNEIAIIIENQDRDILITK